MESLERASHTMASAGSPYHKLGGRKGRDAELWRACASATRARQGAWRFGTNRVDRNVGSAFVNRRNRNEVAARIPHGRQMQPKTRTGERRSNAVGSRDWLRGTRKGMQFLTVLLSNAVEARTRLEGCGVPSRSGRAFHRGGAVALLFARGGLRCLDQLAREGHTLAGVRSHECAEAT